MWTRRAHRLIGRLSTRRFLVQPDQPMEYRTAFLTGASSGIGEALARRLAAEGVEVALAARRAEALTQLARDIRAEGGNARAYPLDVTCLEDVKKTIRQADDEMGGLDLVIANAGVSRTRWSGDLHLPDCEETLRVNVDGALATLTAVLDRMVERRRGHLVGVSSLAQYRGLPSSAVYSGSKAFLSRLLEGMRVDLRGTGVTVTDVRPGFVRTPLTTKNRYKMPWLLEPEDAAARIWRGIESGAPVVAFPWQLAALVRMGTLLPIAIYDRTVSRAKGAQARSSVSPATDPIAGPEQ